MTVRRILEHGQYHNDTEKGIRRNTRTWRGSRLPVSGLLSHPFIRNPRPKGRVVTPGDTWGVSQPPGPSSPDFRRHPRQTGGTSTGQVSTDCARGWGVQPILTTPRPARGAQHMA